MPKCDFCGLLVERLTRDHIIPKAWGGSEKLYYPDPVTNIRLMCEPCNILRGRVGHCIGAMAAVRMIPGHIDADECKPVREAARNIVKPFWRWWFHKYSRNYQHHAYQMSFGGRRAHRFVERLGSGRA